MGWIGLTVLTHFVQELHLLAEAAQKWLMNLLEFMILTESTSQFGLCGQTNVAHLFLGLFDLRSTRLVSQLAGCLRVLIVLGVI